MPHGTEKKKLNTLVALFKDSRDNSCIRPAKNQFTAFKAAIDIAIVHMPYPTLEVLVYVTIVVEQPWYHQVLMAILRMDFIGPASQMMVQVHRVPKEAQMPVLYAIDTFLREFGSTLILITGPIDEILKFCEACE